MITIISIPTQIPTQTKISTKTKGVTNNVEEITTYAETKRATKTTEEALVMSDQVICTCTKETAINDLKQEVTRLREFQYNDHDLLVRVDMRIDNMSTILESLVRKVDDLVAQPVNRYDKYKLTFAVAIITAIATYIANLIISRL